MAFSSPAAQKLLRGVLTGLSACALALVLHFAGLLDIWEARTWDWRVRLLARPGLGTDQIRLILLDQASLTWAKEENGLSWPWPREAFAAIIDFCRRGGAKAVAFDVLFTEPSKYGVEDDALLGRSMALQGHFAQAFFLERSAQGEARWPAYRPKQDLSVEGLQAWLATSGAKGSEGLDMLYDRATFPIPEIAAEALVLCNVHHLPDPDGVYRRARLFGMFDNRPIPSLGLGAYLAGHPGAKARIEGQDLRIDGRTVRLDPGASALLNFRGPSGTHKAVSAAAVLQSEIRLREGKTPSLDSEDVFKDRYVFFGYSAPGLFDLRVSPVSAVYAGVEIWATSLDNFLSNDFLRRAPATVTVLLTLALSLACGCLVSLSASPWKNATLYGVFLPLPVLLALGSYRLGFQLPLLVQELGVALGITAASILNYAVEGRQKRFIKNAFKQYLSHDVIEELIRNPERLRLGGERKILSIFFSDLQGFTGISEGMTPEDLTALLNEYLTAMTDIIHDEGGTVDKFEGDAIIAFWNAPLEQPDHAERAVRAALRCQAKLAELRPVLRERAGKDLFMRIGLNTGQAVVGNMGSHSRFDYTMLGDAVNLAARLEGVNKSFATGTMVSEAVLAHMANPFPARELSRVAVVGRKEPVRVFEPFFPEDHAAQKDILDEFSKGLAAFYQGDFQEALARFVRIEDSDPPAKRYAEKCKALLANPPQDWQGVWVMDSK